MTMKIVLGADHGGVGLKEAVKHWLAGQANGLSFEYEVEDKGTHSEASCDYPDFARLVAVDVAAGKADRGIVFCGTGIGVAIAANKIKGIRAAVCGDAYSARMCRQHNDANILTLGERVTGKGLALDIVKTWLETAFEGGRHQVRVDKIMALEE